jgi:hypothetical protein
MSPITSSSRGYIMTIGIPPYLRARAFVTPFGVLLCDLALVESDPEVRPLPPPTAKAIEKAAPLGYKQGTGLSLCADFKS